MAPQANDFIGPAPNEDRGLIAGRRLGGRDGKPSEGSYGSQL